MPMKTFICLWGLFFVPFTLFAQLRLAIVPANGTLYASPGPTAKTMPLAAGSFVYLEKVAGQWWKAQTVASHQNGYVPAGALQPLNESPRAVQQAVFISVFGAHQQLADSLKATVDRPALAEAQAAARRALEISFEEKFDPVLGEFPDYFRLAKDPLALDQLLAALWADEGSQAEMPAVALAQCLADHPELVVAALRRQSPAARDYLVGLVEHGIDNQVNLDENEKLDPAKAAQLKAKLATVRQ
jgi:hypothetical protein